MQPQVRSDSFAGPIGEARVASTAGGGTSLSTTVALVALPIGTARVGMIARNFTTAVVVKFAVNPYLLILRTDNNLGVTADYSAQGQQPGGTGITLGVLDVLGNGGSLYVGSHLPFRGVAMTFGASVNAVAATLLTQFWNGSAWAPSTGFTDNTASGGATFAQTGTVVWTVPATWAKAYLNQTLSPAGDISKNHQMPYADKPRYWMRWSVSAKMSTTVVATLALAMNRSTAYAEAVQDSLLQFRADKQVDGAGCIEMLTDAGTANSIVNVYASPAGSF